MMGRHCFVSLFGFSVGGDRWMDWRMVLVDLLEVCTVYSCQSIRDGFNTHVTPSITFASSVIDLVRDSSEGPDGVVLSTQEPRQPRPSCPSRRPHQVARGHKTRAASA